MADYTSRRNLKKPVPPEKVLVNDLNGNTDAMDAWAGGPFVCTSTTRPNAAKLGDLIFEQDTNRLMLRRAASWVPVGASIVTSSTNPNTATASGDLIFETDTQQLKVRINGSTWRTLNPKVIRASDYTSPGTGGYAALSTVNEVIRLYKVLMYEPKIDPNKIVGTADYQLQVNLNLAMQLPPGQMVDINIGMYETEADFNQGRTPAVSMAVMRATNPHATEKRRVTVNMNANRIFNNSADVWAFGVTLVPINIIAGTDAILNRRIEFNDLYGYTLEAQANPLYGQINPVAMDNAVTQ